jgi:hypothetical protein
MKTTCFVLFVAACGTTPSIDDTAPPAPADGTYKLSTRVDVSAEVFLPEQIESVVTTMRTFSTNPGKALIELAGNAGVPAVGDLLDVVPGALVGELEAWINGYITPIEVHGVKLTDAAGSIATLAKTTLSIVDLDSTLTISGTSATQTFTTLDLSPSGIDTKIALDGPIDARTATTTVTTAADGQLVLGDESFGFDYGAYAWAAINQQCTQMYGADIRTMIGHAVDCRALSYSVANECVLGECVGHQYELDVACEAGLDYVVDQMREQLEGLRLDEVHFARGTATTIDASGDGVADRLMNGTWDAEINGGQGLRPVSATFTGAR